MHLANYLGYLHQAGLDLAEGFKKVGDGHAAEADVYTPRRSRVRVPLVTLLVNPRFAGPCRPRRNADAIKTSRSNTTHIIQNRFPTPRPCLRLQSNVAMNFPTSAPLERLPRTVLQLLPGMRASRVPVPESPIQNPAPAPGRWLRRSERARHPDRQQLSSPGGIAAAV